MWWWPMGNSGRPTWLVYMVLSGAVVCPAQADRQTVSRIVDRYADLYQVPRELVHSIIEIESNWRPYVVSEKGAVGLMQLMPATAATFGVTNRFDIDQNIRGGVAYCARLLALFGGDLRLVAAAYYAGEGRILRSGLGYANADVYRYVLRLTREYREKRSRAGFTMGQQTTGGTAP
jgi:soluble lytic murein transglycosylase-like protein